MSDVYLMSDLYFYVILLYLERNDKNSVPLIFTKIELKWLFLCAPQAFWVYRSQSMYGASDGLTVDE